MKRDGYRDKYTKPKRKEATTEEYNLAVQAQKKQKRPKTTKRLQNNNKATMKTRQKRNAQFANFSSKNEASLTE